MVPGAGDGYSMSSALLSEMTRQRDTDRSRNVRNLFDNMRGFISAVELFRTCLNEIVSEELALSEGEVPSLEDMCVTNICRSACLAPEKISELPGLPDGLREKFEIRFVKTMDKVKARMEAANVFILATYRMAEALESLERLLIQSISTLSQRR